MTFWVVITHGLGSPHADVAWLVDAADRMEAMHKATSRASSAERVSVRSLSVYPVLTGQTLETMLRGEP